ncbi:MFS transporter [Pelosinus sp. UFO1]|uniref:MFS transporter n=1 Tax=Pelosinus sp. UFO1 TaxID=484770 RepID=UPI0004D1115C|nr:MFS transporter [Pelosinus sp. UFO1]AIF49827.1 major facilitator superfamily MFS_1 [Pelosinus sp. UFO1]
MFKNSARVSRGFHWKARYTVLSILWVGWLFSFLDRMVVSIALPFIGREFQLNAASQGMILSTFFAGYAIFQIPGGMLADKFGPRRVMAFAIVWWSVFTSLTGMVLSYPLMLICRFVFGIGEGCFPGSSFKTIAMYFPPKERATATAIQGSVNALGPAVASLVAAGIIAAFGWNTVFITLGIPGLVIGLAIWFYVKDNPAEHPHITPEELSELNLVSPDVSNSNISYQKITFKEFLQKPVLWQMLLIWFLFDITFWGFISWLPSYLMEVRGFSLLKTGFYGSLPFFIGTIGMLIGGYLSDYFKGKRKWLFIPSSLMAAFFIYMTFSVAAPNMVIVYQSVAALFMFLAYAAFWGLVVDSIPADIMGAGSGMVNLGGQIAGLVSPFAMGHLIDLNKGSFDMAFAFLAIAAIGSAAVAFTVKIEALK